MLATMTASPETFADRLKAAITAAGVSQRELAERVGVRQATVSSWCTGRTLPDLDDAYRTALALGVHLEDLCPTAWGKAPRGQEEEA